MRGRCGRFAYEARAGTDHRQSPRSQPRGHGHGDAADGGGGAPGFGAGRVVLVALAVLAGPALRRLVQRRARRARDAAAGRTDKPAAAGLISVRALWLGAAIAVPASLALAAALGPVSLAIDAAMTAVAGPTTSG